MRFDPFGIFARRDLRERRRESERYALAAARTPGPERWAPMSPERKAKLLAHPVTTDADWQPGDVVRDANNDLWWRSWDGSAWGFLLRYPGKWVVRDEVGPKEQPLTPMVLVVRDGQAVP